MPSTSTPARYRILYAKDLHEMFDTVHTSKLIRVLDDNKIDYLLTAKGHPITTIDAVNRRLNPYDPTEEELSFT